MEKKDNNNNNNLILDKKFISQSSEPFEIDQDIKNISLKPIEQKRLDIVFDSLIKLENEPSSDEDSLEKKYLKEVEQNAKEKKMFNFNKNNNKKNQKIYHNKISQKGLRKMLRKYSINKKYSPEEIEQMIWEVDEDMDKKVSKYELEKMYKRCITDKEELEPKKLFYFIQFLMFDKENKLGINEEDTLELLKVRHRDDKEFNESINEIFYPDGKKNDYNENRLNYNDFLENMTNLVLKKRDMIKDKRENYCNYIKDKI